MGSTVLDAARHFSGRDLGAPRDGRLTYFTVLGELVRYPRGLAVPLAVLATAVLTATTLYSRRRGGVRARGVARAAAGLLALLVATTVVGFGAWQALLLVRPGYGSFAFGDTYRSEWYAAGALALTAALIFAWYLLLRRRQAPEEVGLAIWVWLAVFALVTAVFVPGAAYLFTWPPLVGSIALAAAVRRDGTDPTWRWLACGSAAVPAVALLLNRKEGLGALRSTSGRTMLVSDSPMLPGVISTPSGITPINVGVAGLARYRAWAASPGLAHAAPDPSSPAPESSTDGVSEETSASRGPQMSEMSRHSWTVSSRASSRATTSQAFLLGLLVSDPWAEERPLAVALYAGAIELAREMGVREVRARSVRHADGYPHVAGYRWRFPGGWYLDTQPRYRRKGLPAGGWRRMVALLSVPAVPFFRAFRGAGRWVDGPR
jgi:hypothetical protein